MEEMEYFLEDEKYEPQKELICTGAYLASKQAITETETAKAFSYLLPKEEKGYGPRSLRDKSILSCDLHDKSHASAVIQIHSHRTPAKCHANKMLMAAIKKLGLSEMHPHTHIVQCEMTWDDSRTVMIVLCAKIRSKNQCARRKK
ncbi:hypothetical protein E5288_WYG012339 [Bos mutus]|uniref:Uncharacterized protein n=1 Tax=Bos mutus TaxID=72004 RepID=A0A6B0RQ24_9CETA|nr:hypothetical protein [Bos mutus]